MSNGGFMDPGESVEMLLESMAADGYESISTEEMLEDFVARTPALSPAERADILATALGQGESTNWGRVGGDIQQWGQFASGLTNLAGQIAGLFPGQAARDAQRVLQTAGGIGGALTNVTGGLMQQFGRPQPGQTPAYRPGGPTGGPSPGPSQTARIGSDIQQWGQFAGGLTNLAGQIAGMFPGQTARDVQRGFQTAAGIGGALTNVTGGLMQQFGQPQPGAPPQLGQPQPQPGAQPQPQPQLGGQSTNATALLQQLISSPQLIQALAGGIVGGPTASREVVLEIAGHNGEAESVAIPLGAVMNAISTLATEALAELNANTHPSEPEVPDYLMSESGELLVDPASAEDRAALVVEYFRRAREAERAGLVGGSEAFEGWGAFEGFEDYEGFEDDEDDESLDESAEWDDYGF